jgi:DNA polymerase
MKTLEIDIETFSSIDLKKAGVYKYAESPDFEILLFAYSVDGGEIKVVDLASGENLPEKISEALQDPDVTKWAFNSQFERICLSRWLGLPTGKYLDPRSWKCSMVWSAYMGLPLSLEGVGAVLGLEKQKLTEGRDLIRYFCTPCRPTIANGQRTRNLPCHDPVKWEQFKAYNARDVEVEMAIQKKLASFPFRIACGGNFI